VGVVMADDHGARETLLANLGREARHSGRLLSSLLRIARLDQAEPMPTRAVDIVALCQAEIDRISSVAPHLQCPVEVADTVAARVGLSPDTTREALANVVDNARRHARHTVTLQVRVIDDQLRLAVRDDGPGLGPDMVDTAFERFVSLDGCGGSGLGLPIARATAQKSGGSLRFADHQFILSLPYRPMPAAH
jgi:signal transduction histidine kinase